MGSATAFVRARISIFDLTLDGLIFGGAATAIRAARAPSQGSAW
jgi:predicted O-linked N-acetylglucosamine transferase (SPINDLY family)